MKVGDRVEILSGTECVDLCSRGWNSRHGSLKNCWEKSRGGASPSVSTDENVCDS